MKLRRKTVIILILIILIPTAYYFYCEIFWRVLYDSADNYYFSLDSVIDKDSVVTLQNYKEFTWERDLIEPYHAQWLNKTKLFFVDDSLLVVSVIPSYLEGNEWSFPILYPLGLDREEETFNTLYKVKNDSIFYFRMRTKNYYYFSDIKLENGCLLIRRAFL